MRLLKHRKHLFVFLAVVLVSIFYSRFIKKDYILELSKQKTETVIGQITREYSPPRAAGHFFDYNYQYQNEKKTGSREIGSLLNSPQRFDSKIFPVVVSVANPDESVILITPEDFTLFSKEFPDSLQWVIQWVKK